MTFWDLVTGNDMNKEMNNFKLRIEKLPADYQAAWEEINSNLWCHADFTGRNIMPILEGVLELFEEQAAEGQSVNEVLGDDIIGFCSELMEVNGSKSIRDKWRKQLNSNIEKKLSKRRNL